MNDSGLPTDISEMITMIEGLGVADAESAAPVRFVVATDWSDGAAPLAVLKAFRAIFHADHAAQLVYAVPGVPTEEDAACVTVLLEGAGTPGDLRGVDLLSFAEVADEPYDTALVPDGAEGSLVSQVGGIITRMHDVARQLEKPDGGVRTNLGDADTLRSRFAGFASA